MVGSSSLPSMLSSQPLSRLGSASPEAVVAAAAAASEDDELDCVLTVPVLEAFCTSVSMPKPVDELEVALVPLRRVRVVVWTGLPNSLSEVTEVEAKLSMLLLRSASGVFGLALPPSLLTFERLRAQLGSVARLSRSLARLLALDEEPVSVTMLPVVLPKDSVLAMAASLRAPPKKVRLPMRRTKLVLLGDRASVVPDVSASSESRLLPAPCLDLPNSLRRSLGLDGSAAASALGGSASAAKAAYMLLRGVRPPGGPMVAASVPVDESGPSMPAGGALRQEVARGLSVAAAAALLLPLLELAGGEAAEAGKACSKGDEAVLLLLLPTGESTEAERERAPPKRDDPRAE